MSQEFDWEYIYDLSDEIECDKNNITNSNTIKFIFSNDGKYILGFKLSIKNSNNNDAIKKSTHKSINLSNLITCKSTQYLYPVCKSERAIPTKGRTAPIAKSLIHKYTIKGKLNELDLNNNEIQKLISCDLYKKKNRILNDLNRAFMYQYYDLPDETLKRLFMIIETEENTFKKHLEYKTLRDILTHPPPQYIDTITNFDRIYGKNFFTYIKYDKYNNFILIDVNSNNTKEKLNKIVEKLISEIKIFYKIPI